MPGHNIQERLNRLNLGSCACADVRRVARKLTSLYDAALAPAGITITQYSLLVNIARAGELSHTVLAGKVGMDRTTLTRNLRPLTRAGWITVTSGEDRRQHLLQLTVAGEKKLNRCIPLWEKIQTRFIYAIGTQPLDLLRKLLSLTESAVGETADATKVK